MPSDPIGDKPLYPSDNAWGIPSLPYASPQVAPQWIVPYRTRHLRTAKGSDGNLKAMVERVE